MAEMSPKQATATPQRQVVPIAYPDWREKAIAGEEVGGYVVERQDSRCVFRAMGSSEMVPEGIDPAYVMEFIVSTDQVDREGDTIEATGWNWDSYFAGASGGKTAGPVLWCHDRSPEMPLGVRCPPDIKTINGAQVALAIFPTPAECGFGDDEPHLAKTLRCLYACGAFKSTSVGMLPLDYSIDEATWGLTFHECEGLEWSLVPVPANPGCYQLATSKGIALGPLDEWARKSLDGIHGRSGLYVTRRKLEAVLRSCGLSPDVKFFDLTEAQMRRKINQKGARPAAASTKDIAADMGAGDSDDLAALQAQVADLQAESSTLTARVDAIEQAMADEELEDLQEQIDELSDSVAARRASRGTTKAPKAAAATAATPPADFTLDDLLSVPKDVFRSALGTLVRAELNQATHVTGKVY